MIVYKKKKHHARYVCQSVRYNGESRNSNYDDLLWVHGPRVGNWSWQSAVGGTSSKNRLESPLALPYKSTLFFCSDFFFFRIKNVDLNSATYGAYFYHFLKKIISLNYFHSLWGCNGNIDNYNIIFFIPNLIFIQITIWWSPYRLKHYDKLTVLLGELGVTPKYSRDNSMLLISCPGRKYFSFN